MDNQKILDKGLDRYLKEIEILSNKSAKIGVLAKVSSEKSEDGDITLYEKAVKNEFGIGVPKRSFMRVSFDIFLANNELLFKNLEKSMFSGNMTGGQILNIMGQTHTDQIKRTIKEGRQHFKLNSKKWSKIKGLPQIENATPEEVTPLIHTGQMRQSITFKVVENGEN